MLFINQNIKMIEHKLAMEKRTIQICKSVMLCRQDNMTKGIQEQGHNANNTMWHNILTKI